MFLVNGQTGLHTKERRTISFWCNKNETADASAVASQFFQDLVSPDQFPLGIIHTIFLIQSSLNVMPVVNFTKFTLHQLFLFCTDYVGFVKRLLKLMHRDYKNLTKLEIELKQLEKAAIKPAKQGRYLLRSVLSIFRRPCQFENFRFLKLIII